MAGNCGAGHVACRFTAPNPPSSPALLGFVSLDVLLPGFVVAAVLFRSVPRSNRRARLHHAPWLPSIAASSSDLCKGLVPAVDCPPPWVAVVCRSTHNTQTKGALSLWVHLALILLVAIARAPCAYMSVPSISSLCYLAAFRFSPTPPYSVSRSPHPLMCLLDSAPPLFRSRGVLPARPRQYPAPACVAPRSRNGISGRSQAGTIPYPPCFLFPSSRSAGTGQSWGRPSLAAQSTNWA